MNALTVDLCVAPTPQAMAMTENPIAQLTPVYFADLANAEAVNSALFDAFEREKHGADVRRTHLFAGRYENTYLPAGRIPELPRSAHWRRPRHAGSSTAPGYDRVSGSTRCTLASAPRCTITQKGTNCCRRCTT